MLTMTWTGPFLQEAQNVTNGVGLDHREPYSFMTCHKCSALLLLMAWRGDLGDLGYEVDQLSW
jgi:hypothetical protein